MRALITLVPVDYPAFVPATRHQWQALVYEAVGAVNPELAREVHDEGRSVPGEAANGRRFKLFVFSTPDVPRGYRFEGDEQVFDEGRVYWQVSSPRAEFVTALIAGLAVQRRVRMGRTVFAVEDVSLAPLPPIVSPMRMIALSPLVASTAVRRADGRLNKVYLRDEASFAAAVAANLQQRYLACYGQAPADSTFHFAFDRDYLRRAGGLQSRRVTRQVGFVTHGADGAEQRINIHGLVAPFIVSGSLDLIRFGWECGFGEANSQGFGMAGMGER